MNIENKIYITHTNLFCATGTHRMSLLGSIMANNCAPVLHEEINSENLAKPSYLLPVVDLSITEQKIRLTTLLKNSLASLTANLIDFKSKKILLHLILPANMDLINIEAIQLIIKDFFGDFNNLQFSYHLADQNNTQQLAALCTLLATQQYEAIIFGGVDSLIDHHIINQLYEQKRLFIQDTCYGIAPGEAAGFIVLQLDSAKSLACIKKIATATEPNAQYADTHVMTGLVNSIRQLLNAEMKEHIDCIIQPLGAEPNDPLEWYQVTQAIWPNQPVPEELNLFQTLGEVGAATLPLNLILATARLKLFIPHSKKILVCDANQMPHRGALLITSSNEQYPN